MGEFLAEALSYIQGVSRYKWLSLLFVWVVCLSGWTYVSQMPDEFEANARVHVDTQSVLRPLLKGLAIQPDINGQVRLMTRLMFSRPNLEKISRMTDLDLNAKDDGDMDDLIIRLHESMKISAARRSNLFTISAFDANPKIAKRMVESLLTIFVEDTLGKSRKDSDSAQRFLDQQIKEYELRLMEAERSREEFKRKNLGLLPGEGTNLYGNVQVLNTRLEDAKLSLQEAQNRRDEIKRQLDGEGALSGRFAEGLELSNPTNRRIAQLQERIDDLLLNYTDAHPNIFVLRQAIVELEAKRAEELAALGEGGDGNPVAGGEANPVFQQLKLVLTDAGANVASLHARVKNYEEKILTVKEQLDARLKVETQLHSLNRDYSAIQGKYGTLVQRRETARLSENLEQNTEAVKFRIIDPPRVPLKPSGPNRILYYSGVAIGAFLFGLSVAILMTLLRPTFGSTQKVRDITGLPVLGSVSMNWIDTIKRRKWRGFLRFCAASLILLLMFSALIVLEVKGFNLYSLAT